MKKEQSKTIVTREIKRWNLLTKLIYLIPLVLFIYGLTSFLEDLSGVNGNPENEKIYFYVYVVSVLALSFPLILIGKVIVENLRRRAMKNASFRAVRDIDYHRDELKGLSPADISFLENLKLEPEKDIPAMILYYEMLGVLEEREGAYHLINESHPDLRKSDRILLEALTKDASKKEAWALEAKKEVEESSLIRRKKKGKSKWMRVANGFLYISIFILLALVAYILYHSYTTGNVNFELYENFERLFSLDIEGLNLTTKDYLWVFLFAFVSVSFFGFLLAGFAIFFLEHVIFNNREELERTSKGNELTELVFGLKNFMRDFTILSERDKLHLALWDELLVYAVTLEENDQVIEELRHYRVLAKEGPHA